MIKSLLILSCVLHLSILNFVEAKSLKHKKKVSFAKTQKKRKIQKGNGIDLKVLTNQSPYIKNSSNGINSIEKNSSVY